MIRIGSTIFGKETINIMIKKVITTEKSPTAIGPYSQVYFSRKYSLLFWTNCNRT